MATINELAAAAGELNRQMNVQAGLSANSPVVIGLASGLDVAITVFEQSTGARVGGFSRDSAERVVKYFQEEANRSESVEPQIAFFYRAWAQVLASKYLDMSRPAAPSVDDTVAFVNWLLRHGRDFEIYRTIYRQDVDKFVATCSTWVMGELEKYPTQKALEDRFGELISAYQRDFQPIAKRAGGIRNVSPDMQVYIVQLEVKIQIITYYMRYKYELYARLEKEVRSDPAIADIALEDIYKQG